VAYLNTINVQEHTLKEEAGRHTGTTRKKQSSNKYLFILLPYFISTLVGRLLHRSL
jgi:hypothetical protein